MNARPPLPGIIAKLIPRLASPHDGEVIATARAVGRALQSAGCDWHDLTKAIIAPAPPPLPRPPCRTESDESAEIRVWLEAVAQEDWPNTWTSGFIDNILRRPNLDRLSKKQLAVVNNIVGEAYRRGVRPDRRAA
jgi:hypothetical protein